MKSTPRLILPLLCVAGTFTLYGQELTGSLTAQGSYKPEIRPHTRISGLPVRLNGDVPEGSLPVSLGAVPTAVAPSLSAMLASDKGLGLPTAYRGYFELLSGSYLNTSVSAGYRFLETEDATLGAYVQHNSSSLYRPESLAVSDVEPERKKLYDETIGLYGSLRAGDAGLLSAEAVYHLGYFNYYSGVVGADGKPSAAPSQTLNDFSIKGMWQMTRSARSFFVDGEVDYRYFGYRRFYMPLSEASSLRPPKENDLRLKALLGYRTDSSGTISLDAAVRMLLYSNRDWKDQCSAEGPFRMPGFQGAGSLWEQPLTNYGIVSLTPAYSYLSGSWSMRAGVRVDLSWNVPTVYGSDSFSAVHVAPDVAVSYSASKVTAYLSATGGVTPNTLAGLSELDMYQSPAPIGTMPVYRPVEATIGLNLGDFNGFSAGVHASYAIADNTPLSGWYAYWMHDVAPYAHSAFEALPSMSLKGFSIGADMGYKLGTLLAVNGSVAYQRQSGENGYFNGLDRPRWVASAEAEVTPLKGLSVGVGYTYRGVRSLYVGKLAPLSDIGVNRLPDHNYDDGHSLRPLRLPDIYDLGARVSYTLKDRYTFSARVDNILGCDDRLIPIVPTEGMSISGGVSILF